MKRGWRSSSLIAGSLLVLCGTVLMASGDRDTKVRKDKQDVTKLGTWIYDDLAQGITVAKKANKPLMVVIR